MKTVTEEQRKSFSSLFFGKVPCYNSVTNRVGDFGLSVYEDDIPKDQKYGIVVDESILIYKEKQLLVLGFKSGHEGRTLEHKDITVLDMRIGEEFKREDVKASLESVPEAVGVPPEYEIPDGTHNLVGGFKDAGNSMFVSGLYHPQCNRER